MASGTIHVSYDLETGHVVLTAGRDGGAVVLQLVGSAAVWAPVPPDRSVRETLRVAAPLDPETRAKVAAAIAHLQRMAEETP